jgi:hypothetical protein
VAISFEASAQGMVSDPKIKISGMDRQKKLSIFGIEFHITRASEIRQEITPH